MSCERAVPLLYDLIDREIERDDAVWLAEHLASCPACAVRLVQMRAAEERYARDMPAEAPTDLAGRISETVWSSRQAPPARARETIAAGLTLLAVAAALALYAPGASENLFWWLRQVRELSQVRPEAAVPGLLEQFAATGRALAASLPSPPGGGWAPLAAAAVALQILGSAWLLLSNGRRPRREEAR